MMSISRTLFIILFLMCNVQRPSSSVHSSTIINSDVLYMLILLAFGVSNGYVTSMCMISVASLEHNPHLKGRREDVDVAATVATFCLVGGIVVGSLSSFAVRAAVCECNPFTM
jgi:equilibrative nucleoside transporter 1/2/3